MAKNHFLISIILLGLLFVTVLFLSINSHKKLQQSELEVQNIKNQAQKFSNFKNTWDDSPIKSVIKKLQSISTVKVSHRGKSVKLHFKMLSKSELDQVMNIIYKKPVQIESLKVFNLDNNTAAVHMEILK